MMDKKERKRNFECTIAPELFEQWKLCKRRNDVTVIAKELGYSVPVINRALLHGYVASPELTGQITNFFVRRLESETGQAEKLGELLQLKADQELPKIY